ncbi:hypothetical protein CGCF415_v003763 [Colletotrichum fructicola]|nr:hypothetical protein CGCF415_v003763 [Colletotrichum fructicola]
MSGHDPISALLSIFPDVTEAAEKYKITEPDRESRGLARGIANEKIQFHETAQRLNFLSIKAGSSGNCNWVQRAEERFGSEKAGQILHDLQSLTSQLLTLETDLINAGRKKEILDKIQGRAFGPVKGRDRNSRTQLQRTLDGVSNTNRLLASRLSSAPTLLTRAFQTSDTRGPLLFRREFGSSKTAACKSPSSTMWSIPSQEPVLAKLGICLIELAFGKPLSELRREDSGRDSLKDHDELDADSLDLITAKKLFMSQRIRYEFGEPFEDAVRACVHQQFRAEKSDNIVKLDREHPSFLQNAVTSIISPLQLQMKKYLRAGQRNSVSNKETNSKAFNESVTLRNRSSDVNNLAVVDPSTPRISTPRNNKPQPSNTNASSSRADNGNEGTAISHFQIQSKDPGIIPLKINLYQRTFADMPSGTRDAAPLPQGPAIWQDDAEKARGREQHIPLGPVGKRSGLRVPSPSEKSQEDSEWAYGSVTETTESAHASVADALDQLPARTDHPLLSRIAKPMLRVFLDNFDVWKGRPAGSTRGGGNAKRGRGGVPSRKRAKNPPNRGHIPEDEDDDNDEEDDNVENGGGGKTAQLNNDNLTLACPFFKKDSRTHGSCCGKRLTRIRDVKQHLKRRHYIPIYCPICNLTFNDEMARDNHTNEFSCQRGRHPRPEGINLRQQNELGKRASRQHSEDKQWFAIFAIIFPGDPLPSSAYIDPSLLDNANAYQDFVTTEGSGILYQFLQSRNALNLNVPRGLEHDLETFQRQMLAEGLVAISEEWSRRGAGAALSSESESAEVVNADSASLGADVESMSSLQPTSITSSIGHPGYAISDSEPPWSYQNPQQGFVPSIPPFEMTQMTMIIDGSTADESLDWAGTHDHDFTDYM